MRLNDNTYDLLNKIERWLPACGALYLGLCDIWGLAFGCEVNETLAVVATFIAAILEISSVTYHKEQK